MQDVFEAFDKTRDLKDKPFKALCYAADLQRALAHAQEIPAPINPAPINRTMDSAISVVTSAERSLLREAP